MGTFQEWVKRMQQLFFGEERPEEQERSEVNSEKRSYGFFGSG